MLPKPSAIYPVPLNYACELAERAGLPSEATFIEPTSLVGLVCASERDAIYFLLHFNDAQRWPAADPDVFLMIVPVSDEVQDWINENPHSGDLIDMVAIEFQSASDLRRFEKALWP
ncbi:hypothetical protein [Microvirga splendida]|uniref:Uncharacterized protein n=1 Tax=Microvirga splendida TaxID=2795727 RepID=A0ABS0XVH4_9HYPH|nr:hypothetical protein [Microvirga splendida]MBJ6124044.1 hypothetical protein [Microvirga splendida]